MNILFLDDNKERIKLFKKDLPGAVCVETAKECVEELQNQHWDWVFLDHDLGGETYVPQTRGNTGSGVVRWILKNPDQVNVKRFIVHTLNHDAGVNMVEKLKSVQYNVQKVPFIYLWEWNVIQYILDLEKN